MVARTNDMRAQAQNRLPASSFNLQFSPRNIGESQDDGVESFTEPFQAIPAETPDEEFESVTRTAQSSSVKEQDDNCVDPEPTAEFEEAMEPDVAPMEEVQAPNPKFKKGKKKPQSTAYAF